jgi:hypothetical protein
MENVMVFAWNIVIINQIYFAAETAAFWFVEPSVFGFGGCIKKFKQKIIFKISAMLNRQQQ